MTIETFGLFSENRITGLFEYGLGGLGGLRVLSETVALSPDLTAGDSPDLFATFGRSAGAQGDLTVSGSVYSADYDRLGLIFGADGGTGTGVIDGGSSVDLIGDTLSFTQVGFGLNSVGVVSVEDGSTIRQISSGSTFFNVGVDWDRTGGGTGTVLFEQGTRLEMRAEGSSTDSEFLRISVGDANRQVVGRLEFDAAILDALADGEIYVAIGDDGAEGRVKLENNSSAVLRSTDSEYSGIVLGDDFGAVGTLEVLQSSLVMTNDTGETYFNVGRNSGFGSLTLTASAMTFDGADWAGFRVGSNEGQGDALLTSGSNLNVTSGIGTYFAVGDTGGTGAMHLDASTLVMQSNGPQSSSGAIGRGLDAQTTGTMSLTGGSLLELITSVDDNAFVNVGQGAFGTGTLTVEDTSRISILGAGTGWAVLNVGFNGGDGTFLLDSSDLLLRSDTSIAVLRAGLDFDDAPLGGSGDITLTGGSQTQIIGDSAWLLVSQHDLTTGRLRIDEGSTVTLDASEESAYFSVGYRPGSDGQAVISGAASRVSGVDLTQIGVDPLNRAELEDTDPTADGNGLLTLEDGASLQSLLLVIGRGGSMVLDDAAVETTQTEVNTGSLGLRGTSGTILDGDFDAIGADLQFTLDGSFFSDTTALLTHRGTAFDIDDQSSLHVSFENIANLLSGARATLVSTTPGALDINETLLTSASYDLGYNVDNAAFALIESQTATSETLDVMLLGDQSVAGEAWTVNLGGLGLNGVTYVNVAPRGGRLDTGVEVLHIHNVTKLVGTGGDDLFDTTVPNRYVIHGEDGDDHLKTGDDLTLFHGGAGVDIMDYSSVTSGVNVYLNYNEARSGSELHRLFEVENVDGTAHNDRIVGDSADNVLRGGDGRDILKGKGGNDTFVGGSGDDKIRGDNGTDTMSGDAGSDILFGLGGIDLLNGGSEDDFLYGGRDADTLNGGDGADRLRGNLGNDVLNGEAGDDDLRGGSSNDTLNGGADNDFLLGENFRDILDGGSGNDVLTGGSGGGVFDGWRDTFVYAATAQGGGGFDRITDFENDLDKMDLSAFGFTDFDSQVETLASNSGANMRLNFGNGDVLFIQNFQTSQFDVGDVILS